MASLSHICPQCGWDLARASAPVESVYGLRVGVCPRCGGASVRRRIGQASRRFFRAVDAASGLLLALVVTLSLLIWAAGVVMGLAQQLVDASAHVWWLAQLRGADGWDIERVRFAAAFAGIGLASGAWAASALSHWRAHRLAPVWLGLVFAGASAAEVAWVLRWLLAHALGRSLPYAGADLAEWTRRLELTLALGAAMLAGAPIGMGIRWLERRTRASLLRWRRRQLRKERPRT